jgi:hypothetical protein
LKRTVVDRRLPDAYGGRTGPYPLAFVFFPPPDFE